jgi:hypothetical protein
MKKFVKKLLKPATVIALIGLVFVIHDWYMHYDEYREKTSDKKRNEKARQIYEAIKSRWELNPDVKTDFKVEIENYDLIINSSTGGDSDDAVSTGIWKYQPGKYCLSSTREGAAILMTIETQLDNVLEKNRSNNVAIEIEAIGSTDTLLFKKKIYYDGLLGDTIYNIRYYRYDKPDMPLYITFIKDETLITNEYLALLRAYDAVKYLYDRYYIDRNDIKIFTREFDEAGPEYRRLDLQISLRNVFRKEYDELGIGGKLVKKILD